MLRHLLPNAIGVLLVAAFLELPTLVLGEAFASGLGLGINPPTPTWGNLVYEGLNEDRLWQVFLPSVAIAVFTVSAAFVADGIQDALHGHVRVGRRRSLGRLLERVASALVGRPRRRVSA